MRDRVLFLVLLRKLIKGKRFSQRTITTLKISTTCVGEGGAY